MLIYVKQIRSFSTIKFCDSKKFLRFSFTLCDSFIIHDKMFPSYGFH